MVIKPEIECFDGFYDATDSERILQQFLQEHHWPDNRYQHGGRQFILPRLQTWHADDGIRYSYSNNLLETRPWTPLLQSIRSKVETFLANSFNAVLVNYYRNGDDHVGWHADDELELGEQPLIASLTFGAERRFEFKHKNSAEKGYVSLGSGSLLIMQPSFQHHWLHRVPKADDVGNGRINLTFRQVLM
jgi:alkylated DNA repair dioxygenase AlkB